MKLKQWLYGATALAMLAACSDKDIAPDTGGGDELIETSEGYIGIRIQMPTVPSTRAFDPNKVGNDNFDDGVPSEYELNTASLVLFRNDEEAVKTDDKYDAKKDIAESAKCIGAFELKRSKDHADVNSNNQITTQVVRFANVTGMTKNEDLKLFALVMANGLDYGLTPTSISDNYIGKTIKNFQETTSSALLYKQPTPGKEYAKRIFMSNSPLSTYRGGGHNPNSVPKDGDEEGEETIEEIPILPVLVEINKKTYPTEQEAIDNPAGIIHIERAVGKITCSSFKKETEVKVNLDGTEYTLEADEIYWDLGQDMEKTYLVRNTNRKPIEGLSANPDGSTNGNMWPWNLASDFADASIKYRMLGHTPIDAGSKTYYRPYFCQVPGYGKKKEGDTKDNFEDKTFRNAKTPVEEGGNPYYFEPEDAVEWEAESAFYPHENTFPVKYMKYANTTRIGFWVNFKFKDAAGNKRDMIEPVLDDDGNEVKDGSGNTVMKKKDFYVRGLDRSKIYLENPLEAIAGDYLMGQDKIINAVTKAIKKVDGQAGGYDDLVLSDILEFYWEESDEGDGQMVITNVEFKEVDAMPDKYQEMFNNKPEYTFSNQDLITLNNLETVYKYKDGKAFYEVRIKHFGDDLTPWDPNAHDKASDIEQSYGKTLAERKRNYLGRYGIVRNNWYDLNVSTIKRLGPPVDPAKWNDTWPGKPDDNKDEYIAVILRVLSWAKRTQKVEF